MAADRTGDNASAGDLANRLAEFEKEAAAVSDRPQWEELRVRWIGRKQGNQENDDCGKRLEEKDLVLNTVIDSAQIEDGRDQGQGR